MTIVVRYYVKLADESIFKKMIYLKVYKSKLSFKCLTEKIAIFYSKIRKKVSVCPQLKLTSVYHHFSGFVDDLGNLEKQTILVTFSFECTTNSHTTEV